MPANAYVPPLGGTVNRPLQKLTSNYPAVGLLYSQPVSSTAIASTTSATTLFLPTGTGVQGSLRLPAGILQFGQLEDYPSLPGVIARMVIEGSIANTGTPNLTVTFGWKNAAGTYAALCTTGAVAMTTISTSRFRAEAEFVISVYNASTGIIKAAGFAKYATTELPAITVATGTFDTTAQIELDAQLTWSASSASNTQTTTYAYVELLG